MGNLMSWYYSKPLELTEDRINYLLANTKFSRNQIE